MHKMIGDETKRYFHNTKATYIYADTLSLKDHQYMPKYIQSANTKGRCARNKNDLITL